MRLRAALGQRFPVLESLLPDDVFVLGVDEHTGIVIDLDSGACDIVGRGTVVVRVQGDEWVVPTGQTIAVEQIAEHGQQIFAGNIGGCAITQNGNVDFPADIALEPFTALCQVGRRAIGIEDVVDGGNTYNWQRVELPGTVCSDGSQYRFWYYDSPTSNNMVISYEGGGLEDPWWCPPDDIWRWTKNPEDAPNDAEEITVSFEKGDAVDIDGVAGTPFQILDRLNALGGKHGIGRLDLVENRYVGMKSRGCYETPGGTIMLRAHRAMESITLDREVLALKDDLMPRYARLIYNGYWFSPERLLLQQLIDESQKCVNGTVKVKLYKGTVTTVDRKSVV